jgi:2-methylcitrate dehydratase PrpD
MPERTSAPVVEELVDRVSPLISGRLSPDQRAAAKRAFIDTLGVALAGSARDPAAALADALQPAAGRSRVLGRTGRADPTVAALLNGTAAHTLELDDIYAPGTFHPGAPALAAALAVADHRDASGEALLRALIVGYEVGCRVAADLGPAHYRMWHTTGTAGGIGAAAAAATLLGADRQQLVHALALAATSAAGLQQTFRQGAKGKPLHAGHAAQVGVVCAFAAISGATGAPDVLEGSSGLGAATGATSSWSASRAPLRAHLAICDVTLKRHPCCGHTYAPLDAALELQPDVALEQIVRIEVVTYRSALEVAGIRKPATAAEARFSLPFVISVALRDGAVVDDVFTDQSLSDPLLARLMDKVRLTAGEPFDSAFPRRRGARVDIVARSGSRSSCTVEDRLGSPQNPLPASEVDDKFRRLAAAALGEELEAVLKNLHDLDRLESVHQLRLG